MKREARASQPGLPCTVTASLGSELCVKCLSQGKEAGSLLYTLCLYSLEGGSEDLVLLLPTGMAGQTLALC